MKKTTRMLLSCVLFLSLLTGATTSIEAATSQASYKLTAYNSKGKKVYVNAPKSLVVTKVSGKNWYKGTLKYISYKKVGKKWVKQNTTSTVYVPSSKVKGYSKTYSTIKPDTTTKWVRKTKTIKGWFTNEEKWWENVQTGDVAKAGTVIMIPETDGYISFDVQNQYGVSDSAVTLEDAILTQDPNYPELGYADVKYIDYDQQKVTTNTTVKTTRTTYKTTASTQAYTKIYVAPIKNGITLSEYNKIKTGMTYQEVVKIIGENGTLDSSSSGYGITIKIYSWEQKSTYGVASILFENNKVTSKSQAGLR